MDEEHGGTTMSPKIEYPLVSQLVKKYGELKSSFVNGTEEIFDKSGWGDDMKFLYHLTQVFRFFDEKGHFLLIYFQKIPNFRNMTSNSRTILAILGYILMPTKKTLEKVCKFISNH